MHQDHAGKPVFFGGSSRSGCYPYGMRKTLAALFTVGAMLGAVACGSSDTRTEFGESDGSTDPFGNGNGNGNGNGGGGFGFADAATPDAAAEANECRQMDIVFVVDNSGSMAQEQANLKTNFPKFVDVLNAYKTKSGASLDYRLAVTSTDTDSGLKGAFATGGGLSRAWLERTDPGLANIFSTRASLGTSGSSIERGLEAIKLSGNHPTNAGFIRKDALYAFVIITDEDEGGVENNPRGTVDSYLSYLDVLKDQRARWAAAVIAGEKACNSAGFGSAAEAVRLKDFIAKAGKNGTFSSICEGDLTKGLSQALATFDAACRNFPPATK